MLAELAKFAELALCLLLLLLRGLLQLQQHLPLQQGKFVVTLRQTVLQLLF